MPPNMNISIDLPQDSLHLSSQVENSCIFLNRSLESLHTFPVCTLFVQIVFILVCLRFYQSEVIYAYISEQSSRSNMPHKLVHPLPCCKLEVKPAVSVRGCETLCLFDSMPSELFFFYPFFFKGKYVREVIEVILRLCLWEGGVKSSSNLKPDKTYQSAAACWRRHAFSLFVMHSLAITDGWVFLPPFLKKGEMSGRGW